MALDIINVLCPPVQSSKDEMITKIKYHWSSKDKMLLATKALEGCNIEYSVDACTLVIETHSHIEEYAAGGIIHHCGVEIKELVSTN